MSIYHLLNPAWQIPLNVILRGSVNYHAFDDTDDTDNDFKLPENQPFYTLGAGFRWGGMEPILGPRLAMELSAWHELEHRPDDGAYGFGGDRRLNPTAHRFLGRAVGIYTVPGSQHYIMLGLMGGAVIHADRFNAASVSDEERQRLMKILTLN